MWQYVLIALKGFAMGAANVIPGVSGGTVAFITGIYERLITALKSFDKGTIKCLFARDFKEVLERIDFWFLFSLGVGVMVSLVTLARVLSWGFREAPLMVWGFFFGLIAASIPLVGKFVKSWRPRVVVLALLGTVLAVSLVFVTPAQENSNPFYLGLCGVVAVCSMIIPGLSGSFVLVLMGNYQLIMLDSISALSELNFKESLPVLIPVGMGAVVGLIVLARLLNWLFKNFHDEAIGLIAGFILGSLAVIYPWKDEQPRLNEDGMVMVKTEDRTLEARPGTPAEVKASLGKDEEWIVEGYTNWRLPNLGQKQDWMAVGCVVLGIFLLVMVEVFASLGKRVGE